MSSVLEPVADLSGSESCGLCQFPLLGRVRVRVLEVPLAQQTPRALLEAVGLLFAVPYGARQRELLADPVLVHGAEWSAAELLRLLVVRLQPHGLQLAVAVLGKLVVLQDGVHVAVVAAVEGDDGACPQDGLVLVEFGDVGVCDGQTPEEPGEPLDVPGLLQGLTDGRHLADGKVEGR